jgi:hypothetical protein
MCLGGFVDGMLEYRYWELPRLGLSERYLLSQAFQSFWIPSLASRSKVSVRQLRSSRRAI